MTIAGNPNPPRTPKSRRSADLARGARLLGCLGLLALAGCKLPTVNVATPDPIKVDVNMRLDVYQYSGTSNKAKPDEAQTAYEDAVLRERNRMAEVQTLKNNRLVGEDHRGMLFLREKPAGEWGKHVEATVSAENEDRMILMRHEAQESNRQIHEVQASHWKANIEKAFKGEWIEVPGDKPNTFIWIQSPGPKKAGSAPEPAAAPATPTAPAPPPAADAKEEKKP